MTKSYRSGFKKIFLNIFPTFTNISFWKYFLKYALLGIAAIVAIEVISAIIVVLLFIVSMNLESGL